jgi:hypothetical protein
VHNDEPGVTGEAEIGNDWLTSSNRIGTDDDALSGSLPAQFLEQFLHSFDIG